MKKLITAVTVIALAFPVLAEGASNYVSSFKDGTYDVTIQSVTPDLNGKKGTAELRHEGDKVVATVNYEGGREVWKWDDVKLNQEELDPATNKAGEKYGATATLPVAANKQVFNIDCKNKATNDCDAGVDARNNWTLEATNSGFKYVVSGVAKTDKGNPSAQVQKHYEFLFIKRGN